jgi:hypothetical protein
VAYGTHTERNQEKSFGFSHSLCCITSPTLPSRNGRTASACPLNIILLEGSRSHQYYSSNFQTQQNARKFVLASTFLSKTIIFKVDLRVFDKFKQHFEFQIQDGQTERSFPRVRVYFRFGKYEYKYSRTSKGNPSFKQGYRVS